MHSKPADRDAGSTYRGLTGKLATGPNPKGDALLPLEAALATLRLPVWGWIFVLEESLGSMSAMGAAKGSASCSELGRDSATSFFRK